MQYIYGYHEFHTAPDHLTSARVEPRRILSGATFETAKSSTEGAVLHGKHVALASYLVENSGDPPTRMTAELLLASGVKGGLRLRGELLRKPSGLS